jgi:D-3-phosphoglycerate dehydrogenase
MSSYKVLVTDYGWPSIEPERKVLAEIDAEIILPEKATEDEFVALVPEVDGVITNWLQVGAPVIKAAKKCKIIARYGVGVDNIDVKTATELGIIVANVPAYCIDEVSDHAMALLLACARKIPIMNRHIKNGNWTRDVGPPMRRLRGKTLGVVGLGKIGAAVVPKAKAFGLNVIAYDPYLSPQAAEARGARLVELSELLSTADFITIHMPLTPETEGLIGEAELRQMKPTAYLINTARGGIVDTKALYKALSDGWIYGAGLDVLPKEPPDPDDPLLTLENIILTAHAAFLSEESVYDLQVSTASEVARVLTGKTPKSMVNPDALKSPLLRAKELRQ